MSQIGSKYGMYRTHFRSYILDNILDKNLVNAHSRHLVRLGPGSVFVYTFRMDSSFPRLAAAARANAVLEITSQTVPGANIMSVTRPCNI